MKNANGEGSLRQRPDGTWEYRITVEGRKTPMSFYSRDEDGRGAKKKYRAWLKQTGGRGVERTLTVAGWSEVWLASKKPNLAYGTWSNYQRYLQTFILPALGEKKLEAVRPYHIARLYASPAVAALSNSGKNEIRVCLNGIFKSARKNRLCTENPAEDEGFSRRPAPPPKVFSLEQVRRILDFAPSHPWGPYAQAALLTGLRTEELCALSWPDVVLDGEVPHLRIHQVVALAEPSSPPPPGKPDKNGRIKRPRTYALRDTTKSKRERIVALTEEGRAFFQCLPKQGVFVFPGPDHAPYLTPPQLAHRWTALLRDLNRSLPADGQVPLLSPHKARHTYASALLNSDCNIRVVQEQLGHSRLTTTQLYLHTDLTTRQANVSKLAY